ncbi:hypothetical protein BDV38DRAFT_270412 [Aspergillus pseudotamarii]|uniref:Uncharacterized protein n=1 Tax=Aspergillus pseudotamarii TaxID=132259 RepID=A0A5N6SZH9_ASPPS|nr:uncharacterized protein BDV38DRAFT_270412 [Aspergillus pseudotamarii]KAE8138524.1 hypothetical protein BDV38DRAFT_270412 [Aspergillus pseudotamarii]
MPVPHYGVWVGKPTRYTVDGPHDRTPHIQLFFTDDSSRERRAAINVKSRGKESRLVFWSSDNFTPSITDNLSKLDPGFYLVQDDYHYRYRHYHSEHPDLHGIDLYRMTGLLDFRSALVLPDNIPGRDNDILDKMRPILDNAIDNSATIFIFGSSFGSGIHNVHMNQGSLPQFDNGVYSDGALLFKFDDEHWEAVFLAFASQRLPTDDEGKPERDSETLLEMLE